MPGEIKVLPDKLTGYIVEYIDTVPFVAVPSVVPIISIFSVATVLKCDGEVMLIDGPMR